jgi:hypothetical protein
MLLSWRSPCVNDSLMMIKNIVSLAPVMLTGMSGKYSATLEEYDKQIIDGLAYRSEYSELLATAIQKDNARVNFSIDYYSQPLMHAIENDKGVWMRKLQPKLSRRLLAGKIQPC